MRDVSRRSSKDEADAPSPRGAPRGSPAWTFRGFNARRYPRRSKVSKRHARHARRREVSSISHSRRLSDTRGAISRAGFPRASAYCPLLTAHCLLLTAHGSRLTAPCPRTPAPGPRTPHSQSARRPLTPSSLARQSARGNLILICVKGRRRPPSYPYILGAECRAVPPSSPPPQAAKRPVIPSSPPARCQHPMKIRDSRLTHCGIGPIFPS